MRHCVKIVKISIVLWLPFFILTTKAAASIDTLNLKKHHIYPNDEIDDAIPLNELIKNNLSDSLIIKFEDGNYKFKTQVKTYFYQYVKWIGAQSTEVYPVKNFEEYSLIKGYNLDLVRININGRNRIARGLVISNSAEIVDSKIINFNNPKSKMSRGLVYGSNGDKLYICNTLFKNIGGLEDGKTGNGPGNHRALVINGNNVVIDSCIFEGVYGLEDGDIIHINSTCDPKGNWTSLGRVMIMNSSFKGFGKRAIKVQASGVQIINCQFISNEESEENGPRNVIALMGSNNVVKKCDINVEAIAHAIIVHGNDNLIKSNFIWIHNNIKSSRVRGSMIHGIKIYGDSNTVKSNIIKFKSLGIPLQIKKGSGNVVKGNLIK